MNTDCFINNVSVKKLEETFTPTRFTHKQLERYEINEFSQASECASGIAMDFYTRSKHLKIMYECSGREDKAIYFDIYINNVLCQREGNENINLLNKRLNINLTAYNEKNRVTIYLPHSTKITITGMFMDADTSLEPVKQAEKKLLCLGDSITHGYNAKYPSHTYPVMLSRTLNYRLLNQAVSGYVFDEKVIDESLDYKPDVVTVAYGTNDWIVSDSKEIFRDNIDKYFKKLTRVYADSKIFVITPFWREECNLTTQVGTFEEAVDIIRGIADAYDIITIIEGMQILPHMREYLPDGLHPSDSGFDIIAINILKEMQKNSSIV